MPEPGALPPEPSRRGRQSVTLLTAGEQAWLLGALQLPAPQKGSLWAFSHIPSRYRGDQEAWRELGRKEELHKGVPSRMEGLGTGKEKHPAQGKGLVWDQDPVLLHGRLGGALPSALSIHWGLG